MKDYILTNGINAVLNHTYNSVKWWYVTLNITTNESGFATHTP